MGIVAAAGVWALENMVERLAEDHANARRLAAGLSDVPGIGVDPATVKTDIVIFDVLPESGRTADGVCRALAALGVRTFTFGGTKIRAVTHNGVEQGDIDIVIRAIRDVMAASEKPGEPQGV